MFMDKKRTKNKTVDNVSDYNGLQTLQFLIKIAIKYFYYFFYICIYYNKHLMYNSYGFVDEFTCLKKNHLPQFLLCLDNFLRSLFPEFFLTVNEQIFCSLCIGVSGVHL